MQVGSSEAPKAGFWIRFVAYLIDTVIVVVPAVTLGVLIGGVVSRGNGNASGIGLTMEAILLLASIGYFIYFWTRPQGQTLGMKVLHIRVIKTDGSALTVGSAVLRYVGTLLNSIIFGLPIGWIWAAFDSNKQGWHDKVAGTYVVKV